MARLDCARAWPCSAASVYQRTAAALSFGTPRPDAQQAPSQHCAVASPGDAETPAVSGFGGAVTVVVTVMAARTLPRGQLQPLGAVRLVPWHPLALQHPHAQPALRG